MPLHATLLAYQLVSASNDTLAVDLNKACIVTALTWTFPHIPLLYQVMLQKFQRGIIQNLVELLFDKTATLHIIINTLLDLSNHLEYAIDVSLGAL